MLVKHYQQPGVLRMLLDDAGVSHGTVARVDISGPDCDRSRVAPEDVRSPGRLYFCNTEDVTVREVMAAGDGGDLADKVELDRRLCDALKDVYAPRINIKGAIVNCNGRVFITCDEMTEIRVPRRRGWRRILPDRVIRIPA